MKDRVGEESRQGHRCDITLTIGQAGGESGQTSQAKLSSSCLVHLSIKKEHISRYIQKKRQIYWAYKEEALK